MMRRSAVWWTAGIAVVLVGIVGWGLTTWGGGAFAGFADPETSAANIDQADAAALTALSAEMAQIIKQTDPEGQVSLRLDCQLIDDHWVGPGVLGSVPADTTTLMSRLRELLLARSWKEITLPDTGSGVLSVQRQYPAGQSVQIVVDQVAGITYLHGNISGTNYCTG